MLPVHDVDLEAAEDHNSACNNGIIHKQVKFVIFVHCMEFLVWIL